MFEVYDHEGMRRVRLNHEKNDRVIYTRWSSLPDQPTRRGRENPSCGSV